jgi:hypothetical protein
MPAGRRIRVAAEVARAGRPPGSPAAAAPAAATAARSAVPAPVPGRHAPVRPGGRWGARPFGELEGSPVAGGTPPAAAPAPGRRSGPMRPRPTARHPQATAHRHQRDRSGAWPRPRTPQHAPVSRRRPRTIPRVRRRHPGGGRRPGASPSATSHPRERRLERRSGGPGAGWLPPAVRRRQPGVPAPGPRQPAVPQGDPVAYRGAGRPPRLRLLGRLPARRRTSGRQVAPAAPARRHARRSALQVRPPGRDRPQAGAAALSGRHRHWPGARARAPGRGRRRAVVGRRRGDGKLVPGPSRNPAHEPPAGPPAARAPPPAPGSPRNLESPRRKDRPLAVADPPPRSPPGPGPPWDPEPRGRRRPAPAHARPAGRPGPRTPAPDRSPAPDRLHPPDPALARSARRPGPQAPGPVRPHPPIPVHR